MNRNWDAETIDETRARLREIVAEMARLGFENADPGAAKRRAANVLAIRNLAQEALDIL